MSPSRKSIITFLLSIILFLSSAAHAQYKKPVWILTGSFHYFYMNNDEYHLHRNAWNSQSMLPNLNKFHNGFGGKGEIKRILYRNFYVGLESGLLGGDVHSAINLSNFSGYDYWIGMQEVSIQSIPININVYYYLFNGNRNKFYIGSGIGVWYSKLKILANENFSRREVEGFKRQDNDFKSFNTSYGLQLGYEIRLFKSFGIGSKVYYQFADFKGFEGNTFAANYGYLEDQNYTTSQRNTVKSILVFDKDSEFWGPGTGSLFESRRKGRVDMGNWGAGIGLIWYLK